MVAVFEPPRLSPSETPPELATLLTDFERDFQARGVRTLRMAYRRGDAYGIGGGSREVADHHRLLIGQSPCSNVNDRASRRCLSLVGGADARREHACE